MLDATSKIEGLLNGGGEPGVGLDEVRGLAACRLHSGHGHRHDMCSVPNAGGDLHL